MMKYTAQIWGSYWLCFALLMGAMHFAKLTVKDNRKWTETGIHGTLGARGFLREEPESMISEAQSGRERKQTRGEKTSGCPRQLIDYHANRFELE